MEGTMEPVAGLQPVSETLKSLIALEGSPDVISTQLRLLPNSPQILILPPIQEYVEDDGTEDRFDAKNFVRRIYNATRARNEAAQQFLAKGTSSAKRVVFLNGGTAGAVALCVSAISQHETDGDWETAESLFARLVENGVSGLVKDVRPEVQRQASSEISEPVPELDCDEAQDPITRAMRAADALDRETESLQPRDILELARTRHRSSSLPVYGYADHFDDAALFYVFGAAGDGSSSPLQGHETYDDIAYHGGTNLASIKARIQTPLSPMFAVGMWNHAQDAAAPPRSPSCIGEAYAPRLPLSPAAYPLLSPISAVFPSMPATPVTPERVVFGEARLVQVASPSGYRSVKRVRSLDRIPARHSVAGDVFHSWRSFGSPAPLSELDEKQNRRHSSVGITTAENQVRPTSLLLEVPKAVVGRAKRTNVKRVPKQLKLIVQAPSQLSCYVDKGTDAADWDQGVAEDVKPVDADDLEPVFPLVEDLVIHFTGPAANRVLGSVVDRFKDGGYPVIPRKKDDSMTLAGESLDLDGPIEFPSTPKSGKFPELISPTPSHPASATVGNQDDDDYDPFASDGKYQYNPEPEPAPTKASVTLCTPSIAAPEPPTPAQTPPPLNREDAHKFHDFSIAGRRTAVCVQNALRSVLNVYFPPGDSGTHKCHFPLLPDLDGLWKPVFGEAEPESPRRDGRKTDLILAIGSHNGVKREFFSSITAQIEKLGTSPSGLTRSGRLDLRYLIANAMQTFTAQPLANQTQDNPFTNPLLLATLIIPHLETYLLAHAAVRFLLLEYPPEHLATVLALQKLVGVHMVKVAGIVDADGPDRLPFAPRRPGPGHRRQASSVHGLDSLAACEGLTFAKANLLLTSSATDAETATFISTIWTILMDVSHFYVPEHPPPSAAAAGKSLPSLPELNPFPPAHASPPRAPPPPPKTATGLSSPPLSPGGSPEQQQQQRAPPPVRPPSPSPSARSRTSIKTAWTARSFAARSARNRSRGGASELGLDYAGPDDDDDPDLCDAEARRLMPLFLPRGARGAPRKPSSRKALKWLGLA